MFSPDGLADFCTSEAEEAYRHVYNIEMYLRHMLRWELVAKGGKQWRSLLGEMAGKLDAIARNERDLRVIDAEVQNVLSYMLLTELKDAMMSDSIWPIFRSRWPPQDITTVEFKVFNAVRAKIAHFRRVSARDMRALKGFESLVVEMTAHYRGARRSMSELDLAAVELPTQFRPALVNWHAEVADETGVWERMSVRRVHNYLVVDATLRSATVAPDAIADLVERAGTDALFLSIDGPRVAIRAYLPRSLKDEEATKLIDAVQGIKTITDEFLAEDEVVDRFDLEVPYEVELPMDFRV